MSEDNKYSTARKNYWSTMSQEEKSNRGRNAAIAKHKNMTPEQKQIEAMKMVEGRRKKRANG